MCEPKPGQRCATDTRDLCDDTGCEYRQAHPAGPGLDPLSAREGTFSGVVDPSFRDRPLVSSRQVISGDALADDSPFRSIVLFSGDGSRPWAYGQMPLDVSSISDRIGERADSETFEDDLQEYLRENYGEPTIDAGSSHQFWGLDFYARPEQSLQFTEAKLRAGGPDQLRADLYGPAGNQAFFDGLSAHLDGADSARSQRYFSDENGYPDEDRPRARNWSQTHEGDDNDPF
jgi:hypothetical protein